MTKCPNGCPPNAIGTLTFATATAEDRRKTRSSWGTKEVLTSLLVLVCIISAYLYFRG